jgi:hypothetical protein
MRKNILRIVVLISFGILQFLLLPSCTANRGGVIIGSPAPPPPAKKSGPPPWAPAHGHRAKHKYRYYPSHYVYCDTGRGVYFYLEGNSRAVSVFIMQITSALNWRPTSPMNIFQNIEKNTHLDWPKRIRNTNGNERFLAKVTS